MVFDPFRSNAKNIVVDGMLCYANGSKNINRYTDPEHVKRCGALRELGETKVRRLGPTFVATVQAHSHPTFTKSQILKYIQQGVDAGFKLPKGFNNTNLKTKPKSHLNYIAALVENYFESMPTRDYYTGKEVKGLSRSFPRTINAAGNYVRKHVLNGHQTKMSNNPKTETNGWKREPKYHRLWQPQDIFSEAFKLAVKHKNRNMKLKQI